MVPATSSSVAIRLRGVGKSYKIYGSGRDLIREVFSGGIHHREHWALKDISFDITRGQIVGVIGANGSGKSTLLKIITGLLDATTGSVEVNGRISAILELGTGFHPDFTGRENIITGGMCIGMSRKEIEEKLPWIIAFSELESVIDQPFKTYSSGMQARLTFSTAIAVEPEVFIVDEALAAGDSYFVSKCMRRIREICNSGATVLFVSHSTGQVAQLCDTAIWIDKGELREIGSSRDVTRRYDYSVHIAMNGGGEIVEVHDIGKEAEEQASKSEPDGSVVPTSALVFEPRATLQAYRRGPVYIDSVRFLDCNDEPKTTFQTWDRLSIEVAYHVNEGEVSDNLSVAFGIERERDLLLVSQFGSANPSGNMSMDVSTTASLRPPLNRGLIRTTLQKLQLLEGDYLISVGLLPNVPNIVDFYEYRHRAYKLRVVPAGYPSGAVYYPDATYEHSARKESVKC